MRQSEIIVIIGKELNLTSSQHIKLVNWFSDNNMFICDVNKTKVAIENLIDTLKGDGV